MAEIRLLTEKTVHLYTKSSSARKYGFKCRVCGREFQPGDYIVVRQERYGRYYYCYTCAAIKNVIVV
jgi:hypothetical protein